MKVWLGLGFGLAGAAVVAACAGHEWASPIDLARALAGEGSLRSRLLVEWRMPRVLAAALVGVLLGLGGAVFQGVFRNPLAEPYLLGSAGGAALGATVALLVPLGLPQSLLLPVLAFAGAWGATVLVIGVSRVAGAVDAAGMLLAGVAVAAVLGALRSFTMLALSDETVSLQIVLSWVLGGVQTPTWPILGLLAILSAACLGLTLLFARGLDMIGLGEVMATAFGLNVNRFVALAVLAGSVVVAAAVAFGGLVAFVGLAAPHIARWLVGPMHRPLLPASALVGASIVVIADAIARAALPPSEIPLGLVTGDRGRTLLRSTSRPQAAHMTTISADGLFLRRGGATLLAGLSLSLGPASSVAVIGPNGAGKSMLLKALAGIETPTAGRVRVGDHDLAHLSSAARVRQIGYLPQHFEPHWDLRVADLVRLGAERLGEESRAAEEGAIARFDLGTLRARRWSTLSGGERARVLLAMVLAVDPPALLADEPAASLDIRHRIDVVQALVARATDRLSVVVMHDLDLTFRFFDNVIVMDAGRIVAHGRAQDIFDDERLDAAFGVRFERLMTTRDRLLRPM